MAKIFLFLNKNLKAKPIFKLVFDFKFLGSRDRWVLEVFVGFFIAFFLCLICAWIGSRLAREKGRASAGFWLGLFFGPLGIIIALLLPQRHVVDSDLSEDLRALIEGQGKTGIVVNQKDGRTIDAVMTDSAAFEAGVLAGDRIISIDGELCSGDYRSVVLSLVGNKGSEVCISLRRGQSKVDLRLLRR